MSNSLQTPQRLFGEKERGEPLAGGEIGFGAEEYAEVWRALKEAVGEDNYFSGRVMTKHRGFTSSLVVSLIIYRDRSDPERRIVDVAPVWWEMATYDGEREVANDFSFGELRECVCRQSNV